MHNWGEKYIYVEDFIKILFHFIILKQLDEISLFGKTFLGIKVLIMNYYTFLASFLLSLCFFEKLTHGKSLQSKGKNLVKKEIKTKLSEC